MLLKLGQVQTLVVSSPDMAREIMRTHDHIFASRPSLKAARIVLYGGRDMVFAPYGEYWRQIRKLCVNRLLSTKMVQSFRLVLEKEVACMVSKISETCSSSSVAINMSEVLNVFVNKYLCKVLFGDYFSEEGRSSVICKLIEEISTIFGLISVGDFIPSLGWLDKLSGMEARARRSRAKWDDVLDEIIEQHMKKSNEKKHDQLDAQENLDFVDVLLALQEDEDMKFLRSREIKAILVDMIAAGTDTTFLVLDWGMVELARNPEAMKKLQAEVRGIANTNAESASFTEEDLSKMSYLKAVIKEVLRLHPPVSLLIPRESMERCMIQGYEIPKKARVIVNAWAIFRNPEFWDAPEEFRPERFLGIPIDYRGQDFEFIPFGAGRRICPGMQFSVSTLELTFANLVRNFDWEFPAGMRIEDMDMAESPGITTRRRQCLHLVAKPPKR